jgi:hypothetical protein
LNQLIVADTGSTLAARLAGDRAFSDWLLVAAFADLLSVLNPKSEINPRRSTNTMSMVGRDALQKAAAVFPSI